jgi:hypothetical protein
MTTMHAASTVALEGRLSLSALLRRATVGFWHEIVRALLVGLVTLVCSAPMVLATVAGAPVWLVGLATLPLAIALTGASSFATAIARDERASLRALGRIDPVLAVVGTLLAAVSGAALGAPGSFPLLGAALAAVLLLVSPFALEYGAVRQRSGFAAIRGGLILAAYRPSWTLSVLAIACLGGFAVAASAGVLMLVAPVFLLTVGAALIGAELADIDAAQERS